MTDPGSSEAPPTNARLAGRAAADLALGREPARDTYAALRQDLLSHIRRAYSFSRAEADDVVDEAVAKYAAACADGRVRGDTALAYARKIAKHEAVDRIRTRRPLTTPIGEDDYPDDSDDAIARMISATSSAETIEAFLRTAAVAGDTVTTRVLNAYLNLAASLRGDPTSRQVALASQVSHTTVLQVLRRLRAQTAPDD